MASDWPASAPTALSRIDELIKCVLCGENLSPCQALPCGHTFCTLCVKRWRDNSSSMVCPSCRSPAGAAAGIKLPLLDELIYHYTIARPFVLAAIQASATNKPTSRKQDAAATSATAATNAEPLGDPQNKKYYASRKPVRAYKHYSDDMTRKDLREWGLSEYGTKQQLQMRHKAFTELWNVQVDAFAPLKPTQLAALVMHKERQAAKPAITTAEISRTVSVPPKVIQTVDVDLLSDDDSDNGALPSASTHSHIPPHPRNRPPRTVVSFEWKGEDRCTPEMREGFRRLANEIRLRQRLAKPKAAQITTPSPTQTPPKTLDEESSPIRLYGPWRVYYSSAAQRPFYFNEDTGVGTFAKPLQPVIVDDAETRDADASAINRVDEQQGDTTMCTEISANAATEGDAPTAAAAAAMSTELSTAAAMSTELSTAAALECPEAFAIVESDAKRRRTSITQQSFHDAEHEKAGSSTLLAETTTTTTTITSVPPVAVPEGCWTCLACTFINTKGARKCRVCSTKRFETNHGGATDEPMRTRRGTRVASLT